MSAIATLTSLPETIENEDGGTYWLEGHVDPARMVLAVVRDTMRNVDAETAMHLLVGGPTRYPRTAAPDEGRWTYSDQLSTTEDLLAAVRHVWMRVDPKDDERMVECRKSTAGAAPWTRLMVDQ